MALTAFVQRLEQNSDGSTHVVAVVTDNVSIKIAVDRVFPIGTTFKQFKKLLASVVEKAEQADNLEKLVVIGEPIDLTPDAPVEIPPEEIARRRLVLAWSQLQILLTIAAAGVLDESDPTIVSLQSVLKGVTGLTFISNPVTE